MRFWEAYASLFFTSTPVIPSNTLIVEQISSSPWPVAMAARNIWWVKEVKGRGTPRSRPDSSIRPMSLCIHFTEKLVVKSRRKTKGALKAMRPDFAAEFDATTWGQFFLKYLLANGATLAALHPYPLNTAAFHGHWRLCQFLIDSGMPVDDTVADTGETSLHSVFGHPYAPAYDDVLRVLLAGGANVKAVTIPGVRTEAFTHSTTRGEMPLHRAAAFGTVTAVEWLLKHGAEIEVKDANGDTPLMLSVRASTESYWTRRRSPDAVAALLKAGALADKVPFPCGYKPIDDLLRNFSV